MRASAWNWHALHRQASGITHRLLPRKSDAEDAAQEAMLRAYRAHASGAVPDNVEAWMATIAKREAYRIYERQKASVSLDDESISVSGADDPTSRAIDRLVARQMLGNVPAETRELLLRRFALDQSSSEIAEAMDIPATTVRVRLHRTLGHLQASANSRP